MRVSATGGATTTVTTPGPQQLRHMHPRFLPDGHRFLFSVDGRSDAEGIFLGALDGSAPTRLVASDTDGPPAYLPSGLWIVVGAGGHARRPAAGRGAGDTHRRAGNSGRREC